MRTVTVGDVMTKEVLTVHPGDTLESAMEVLREHAISGLPVVDDGDRVVGVLSEKDIARNLSEALGDSQAHVLEIFLHAARPRRTTAKGARQKEILDIVHSTLTAVTVGLAMTPDPVVIGPEASLDEAAGILRERDINRLPVVRGKRLIGILTRHDVLAAWT